MYYLGRCFERSFGTVIRFWREWSSFWFMKQYMVIDLKSFYASVECADRGLDPMKDNLVVADVARIYPNRSVLHDVLSPFLDVH